MAVGRPRPGWGLSGPWLYYFVHLNMARPKLYQVFFYVYYIQDCFELFRSAFSFVSRQNDAVSFFYKILTLDVQNFWAEGVGCGIYIYLGVLTAMTVLALVLPVYCTRKLKRRQKLNEFLDLSTCIILYVMTLSSLGLERITSRVINLDDGYGFIFAKIMYFIITVIQLWISINCFICQGRLTVRMSSEILLMDKKYENIHFLMRHLIAYFNWFSLSTWNFSIGYILKIFWYAYMGISLVYLIPYHCITTNILRSSCFIISAVCSLDVVFTSLVCKFKESKCRQFDTIIIFVMLTEILVCVLISVLFTIKNWRKYRNILTNQNIHKKYNRQTDINKILLKYNKRHPEKFLGSLLYNLLDSFSPTEGSCNKNMTKFIDEIFRAIYFKYGNGERWREYYIYFLAITSGKELIYKIMNYISIAEQYHISLRDKQLLLSFELEFKICELVEKDKKIYALVKSKLKMFKHITKKIEIARSDCQRTFAMLEEIIDRKLQEDNLRDSSFSSSSDSSSDSITLDYYIPDTYSDADTVDKSSSYSSQLSVNKSPVTENNERSQNYCSSSEKVTTIESSQSDNPPFLLNSHPLRDYELKYSYLSKIPTESLPSLSLTLNQALSYLHDLSKYVRQYHKIYTSLIIYLNKTSVEKLLSKKNVELINQFHFDEILTWEIYNFGPEKSKEGIEIVTNALCKRQLSDDAMRVLKDYIRVKTDKEFESPTQEEQLEQVMNKHEKRKCRQKISKDNVTEDNYAINSRSRLLFIEKVLKKIKNTMYYRSILGSWKCIFTPLFTIGSIIALILIIIFYSRYVGIVWKICRQEINNIESRISIAKLFQNVQNRNYLVGLFSSNTLYDEVEGYEGIELRKIQRGIRQAGITNTMIVHSGFEETQSGSNLFIFPGYNIIHPIYNKILSNDPSSCGIAYIEKNDPIGSALIDAKKLISFSHLYGLSSNVDESIMTVERRNKYIKDNISSIEPQFDIVSYISFIKRMQVDKDSEKKIPVLLNSFWVVVLGGCCTILIFTVILILSSVDLRLRPVIDMLQILLSKRKRPARDVENAKIMRTQSENILNVLVFKSLVCVVKIIIITVFLINVVENGMANSNLEEITGNLCNILIHDSTPLKLLYNSFRSDFSARRYIFDGSPSHLDDILNNNIFYDGYKFISSNTISEDFHEKDICIPLFSSTGLDSLYEYIQTLELMRIASMRVALESVVTETNDEISGEHVITYDTSKFILYDDSQTLDLENLRIKKDIFDKMISKYDDGIVCGGFTYSSLNSIKLLFSDDEKSLQTTLIEQGDNQKIFYAKKDKMRYFDALFYDAFSRVTRIINDDTEKEVTFRTFFMNSDADIEHAKNMKKMFYTTPSQVLNSEWYYGTKNVIYSDTHNVLFNSVSETIDHGSLADYIQVEFYLLILIILAFADEWMEDKIIWKQRSKAKKVLRAVIRVVINVHPVIGIVMLIVSNIREKKYTSLIHSSPDKVFKSTADPMVSLYLGILKTTDIAEVCSNEVGKHFADYDVDDVHSCITKSVLLLADFKNSLEIIDCCEPEEVSYILRDIESVIDNLEIYFQLLFPFAVVYGENLEYNLDIDPDKKLWELLNMDEGKILFKDILGEKEFKAINMEALNITVREFKNDQSGLYIEALKTLYNDWMEETLSNIGSGIIDYLEKEHLENVNTIMDLKRKIKSNARLLLIAELWVLANVFIIFMFMLSAFAEWENEAIISRIKPIPISIYSSIPRYETKKVVRYGLLFVLFTIILFSLPLIPFTTNLGFPFNKAKESEAELREIISSVQFLQNSLLSISMSNSLGDDDVDELSVIDKLHLYNTFSFANGQVMHNMDKFGTWVGTYMKLLEENHLDQTKARQYIVYIEETIPKVKSITNSIQNCINDLTHLEDETLAFNAIQEHDILYCFNDENISKYNQDIETGTETYKYNSDILAPNNSNNNNTSLVQFKSLISMLQNDFVSGGEVTLTSALENMVLPLLQSSKESSRGYRLASLILFAVVPAFALGAMLGVVLWLRHGDGRETRAGFMMRPVDSVRL